MEHSDRPEEERDIDVLFRNGNITVFGIVLAFSLGFLNSWTSNPNEWQLDDLPTLALISAGIVFQAHALWRLLRLDSLKRNVFKSGTRNFAIGLVLTASGMLLSIAIDVARILI
ncbi:hypothetical protein IB238_04630 [Rhizobium sp. ARZ01]|uniref:hypothetical protein n=1 Tax=Rhizobium sp. ARZ01 TaxID=2769313 RepID=UPI001781BB4A|nr:hypothetical protein [Rhizobium sp. ARZ01]MBD9371924.1 hypothetical protein [Rhizobium sp. ARZ01]